MFSVFLASALLFVTFAYLREQKARQRRIETQRGMSREQLLPRHYKDFVEVENNLWATTEESARTAKWDTTTIKLRAAEAQIVQEYVRGLKKDFQTGNRIFSVVIGRSPNAELLMQMEWHRTKIEFPYYARHLFVCFRLWTGRISPVELRQLTQIVATLAYEVRRMLDTFEQGGHADYVESLLRNY